MPITPTYPGVYIQEKPSGVRSITGVSTSVTAFLGQARQGPINKAVRIQSYADFERRFGPLQKDGDLGYAVAAFFRNGGSDALVVRIARNPLAASRDLESAASATVLTATALEQGAQGNDIRLQVDPSKKNPASLFDLTVTYAPVDGSPIVETYLSLSMNSHDPRYGPDLVNRTSALVSLTRPTALVLPTDRGTSLSGDLTGVALAAQLDATHDRFLVSCNGEAPVTVVLVVSDLASLATLAAAIKAKVQAARPGATEYTAFDCAVDGSRIRLTSGEGGENSSVRVTPAPKGDVSIRLKLGAAGGGVETDGTAAILPRPAPKSATLTVDPTDANLATLPSAANHQIVVGLDGMGPDTISLGTAPVVDVATLASRVETAVRKIKPADPAYKGFAAQVVGTMIVLSSGSRGTGSAVTLGAANSNDVATDLGLLGGTPASEPNLNLQNGGGDPFDASQAYDVIFGHAADRQGIYALDEVDLFNLLVLPGITDATIQNEAVAYAAARRAFTILEPPPEKDQPDEIGTYVEGSDLTKSAAAALYYPWIKAADPLDGNRVKPFPPGGALAGLYARTDGNRGIWKAPAGIEANLVNVQGTAYALTDGQNGLLNPLGLNSIRVFPGAGVVVWGARTLRGDDGLADEYKYVPVRRLAFYLEESLFRGLQWAVFEPNDEPLWGQIRLAAGSFMQTLFRQGAFAGSSPRDAYFVKCDKETTTPADVANGIVNVLVGFAPLRPAEFVIVTIQQIAGQGG